MNDCTYQGSKSYILNKLTSMSSLIVASHSLVTHIIFKAFRKDSVKHPYAKVLESIGHIQQRLWGHEECLRVVCSRNMN